MSHVVDHMERQLGSARRLLQIVLAQGDAIRAQDVESVLARLADVHAELGERNRLEIERDAIVRDTAVRLGIRPDEVELEHTILGLEAPAQQHARVLSAELKGVLVEAGRTHEQNQVLIRQELAFLGHLIRVISGAPQAGYSPTGWTAAPQPATAIDARA